MKTFSQRKIVQNLGLGLATASLFSAFIYLSDMGIELKWLNTLMALGAFWLLLHIPKQAVLFAGFFIGLLWFYWVGYSFKYTDMPLGIPLVALAFAFAYMLIFGILALSEHAWVRAILLFGISYLVILDFNWMQLSLPFIQSYIGIYKWQLAVVLFALSADEFIPKKRYKPLALAALLFAINWQGYPPREDAPLKIKLVETHIDQSQKWKQSMLLPTVEMVFKEITDATQEGYDLIVFPESVLPLFLNKNKKLLEELQLLSSDIDIVLGALLYENGHNFNVAYHFDKKGHYKIAKKVVLVPFGEYIPLPDFARKMINDAFFEGGNDFLAAKEPTDFTIEGVKFRVAICYEATTDALYVNNPKYMIAISNNAWFAPSIEPTLQNLLLRYYARRHATTIYHSANYKGSGIIK